MTAAPPDITPEFQSITLSDSVLIRHILQHVEVMHGEILDLIATVDTLKADADAARPLLERWQHSKIRKLAEGLQGGQAWPTQ